MNFYMNSSMSSVRYTLHDMLDIGQSHKQLIISSVRILGVYKANRDDWN